MERDEKTVCPHCGQSITYELDIDRGSIDILKAIVRFIGGKGINVVHPNKEMAKAGIITARQLDNLVRIKFHGLIAHIDGEKGNFCVTQKGFEFLAGEPIPRSVTVKKKTRAQRAHVIEHSDAQITIKELDLEWGAYWSANGYEIKEGRVITRPTVKSAQATLL